MTQRCLGAQTDSGNRLPCGTHSGHRRDTLTTDSSTPYSSNPEEPAYGLTTALAA